MRKLMIIIAVLSILYPCLSPAADFLGAPLVSPGQVVSKTETRLEMTTSLSHDEAVAFYKQSLNNNPDIKFRNWKDVTHIEETGNLAWHSISISKEGTPTTITIVKDNWTWIIGTLVIRYIGVFVVLIILLVAMSISGRIMSRYMKSTKG